MSNYVPGYPKPPVGGGGGGNKPPEEGEGGQNPPPEGQQPPGSGAGEETGGQSSSPEQLPPGIPPPIPGGGGGSGGTSGGGDRPQPAGRVHPLNQLDEDEILQAREHINRHAKTAQKYRISQDLVYASISMLEPTKASMLSFFSGGPQPPRRAWAVFSPDGVNEAYETVVNLDSNKVESFVKLPPGTHPSFNADDPFVAQDIVRKDPAVIARARKAGVTNTEYLICDAWSYGYNNTATDKEHRRLMDLYLYSRAFEGDNQYAHPLDFIVTVDMISKAVVDIADLPLCPGPDGKDTPEARPVPPPKESHNYDPRVLHQTFYRSDLKPIEIRQPEGPSFTISGNQIKWQKWEMIVGFNFREGLTLHNISFEDNGKKRSVLYRLAISEMVVPYGDPRIPYYRKSAFDLGEYGLGYNANSLTNGCDCLGEIRYMDFVYADSKGNPKVTKNAICIHEEDAGLLQKHTEFRNGNVTLSRSRKLVVSFIATVTNYDYAYYWIFHQDGTLECDIKATGLLSVHQLGKGPTCGPGGFGTIMAPRLNAPYHQHIFCARFDPMIDGINNTVVVQEVLPLDTDTTKNPFGQGFTTKSYVLQRAKDGATDTNADLVRSWLVTNENVEHPYTRVPVSWKLVAPGFCRMLAGPTSGIAKRAGFAKHNVWVTPYKEGQLYAAGKYINQVQGGTDGVDVWAAKNENIRNTDIVLWHSFGLTHIPRVEDFPLMPVEGASFMFRPSNFFNANPALDVPQPKKSCSPK